MIKVSVIIPVYNEEKYRENVSSCFRFYKNRPYYHFIFVNDGSTDKTRKILETKLEVTKTKAKLISYKNNQGKGYAVKQD
jgi:dolichyl-phosphate beta-glucosyltransferase